MVLQASVDSFLIQTLEYKNSDATYCHHEDKWICNQIQICHSKSVISSFLTGQLCQALMNQVGEIVQLMHDLTLASGDEYELLVITNIKNQSLILVLIVKISVNHKHMIHKHCRKY